MDDGHFDVTCSSLTLDGPVRAGHCSLAFARKHNPELVAEVVFEVYEAGVWVDMLRSCIFFFGFGFDLIFGDFFIALFMIFL